MKREAFGDARARRLSNVDPRAVWKVFSHERGHGAHAIDEHGNIGRGIQRARLDDAQVWKIALDPLGTLETIRVVEIVAHVAHARAHVKNLTVGASAARGSKLCGGHEHVLRETGRRRDS